MFSFSVSLLSSNSIHYVLINSFPLTCLQVICGTDLCITSRAFVGMPSMPTFAISFPLSLCFPPTHRAYFKSQQPTGYINNNHLGALLNHNMYSTILFATSVLATYKCRQERTHSRTLFVLLQTTFLHFSLLSTTHLAPTP